MCRLPHSRAHRLSASVLVTCVVAGCAQPLAFDGALAVTPYDVQPSGRIVVDIQVNDRGPFRFAIDTAATGSFVFSRTLDELALESIPGITATVHGAVASGIFPVVRIDRLAIGRQVWADALLVELPGDTDATSTLDGILGADFLERYSVGFAREEGLLRLYRPQTIANRNYRGWASVHLEPRIMGGTQKPLRYLDIEIAGRVVPALFDLGSGISILNFPAARSLRLGTMRTGQEAELSGAVGSKPLIGRLGSEDVQTDQIRWRNETFLIADLEIFSTLETADRPLAILGSGLFNQRDFIIDFARNRLLIKESMMEQND